MLKNTGRIYVKILVVIVSESTYMFFSVFKSFLYWQFYFCNYKRGEVSVILKLEELTLWRNSRWTDSERRVRCPLLIAAQGHYGVRWTIADALLCHDDELEGRRIAFILYLVPPWDRSLGGTLDLYNVDGKTKACSSTPAATSGSSGALSVRLGRWKLFITVATAGG